MKYPFGTIEITDKSKELIREILESKRLSCGKYVRELEEKFAQIIGVKEAVAVSSGTDALILSLAALYDVGVTKGDEVILPALSFISTALAPLHAGFKPVFVDIEKESLNIDPDKIVDKITKKTKVIIPVHLMGKPAEMDKIMEIANRYNLYVIEDAAEAHGAKYRGRNIGSIGNMGAFSLYIAHIVTTVEGGIVTTNSANLAEILRSLRSHGRACNCKECVVNTEDRFCRLRFKNKTDIRFIFNRAGFSSKMNELEAAIGLGSLELYYDLIEKRRFNFHYLKEKLKKFYPYLRTIELEPYEDLGPHAFPIIIGKGVNFSRDDFVRNLEENDIDTRNLFSSLPTQTPALEFLGYKLGNFPEAEYVGNNGIHIGIHQGLSKEHLGHFIDTVDKFLAKNI